MMPVLAVATKEIREQNKASRHRQSVVANVAERLDVFAACAVSRPAHEYEQIRRAHAERIIEAVIGLSKEPGPTEREQQLVDVARQASRWLKSFTEGLGLNGLHEDITLARALTRVLAQYDDIEPTHDLDRREQASAGDPRRI